MATSNFKKVPRVYGPDVNIAYVSFARAGSGTTAPTVTESNGVVSVTQTADGTFVVTLIQTGKAYNVTLSVNYPSGTVTPAAIVTAKSLTAKTVTIKVVTVSTGAPVDLSGVSIDAQIIIRTNT